MSYHLEIVRTREGRLIPISRQEVQSLCEVMTGARLAPTNLRSAEVDLVLEPPGQQSLSLTLQHGVLWTDWDGDDRTIAALLIIAGKLSARLRGDELETFLSPGETYLHPDDKAQQQQARLQGQIVRRESLKADRRMRLAIIAVFVFLGVVGYSIGRLFEK